MTIITQNDLIGSRVRIYGKGGLTGRVARIQMDFPVDDVVRGVVWVYVDGMQSRGEQIAFGVEDLEFLGLDWSEPLQLEQP